MTDPINESFSALLDNEANNMDIQRLLNAMDTHPEKMTDWKKVASGHSKCHQEQSFDVLSKVNEALYEQGEIDQLSIHQIENSDQIQSNVAANTSWFDRSKKWLGSATIAASVCAATVLAINSTVEDQTGQLNQNTIMATGNPIAIPIGQESLLIQQQLKEHYQQHSAQTSFGIPIEPSVDANTQNNE
ncbi:MAG: hypothetical protein HRU38_06430 [Saccharospirillaceae bacterium]|nr:hypothetical protein [Pseudomonadales bacterium]NRB78291.1 hypothetical protein [Saccharospirillaceae bacterium]